MAHPFRKPRGTYGTDNALTRATGVTSHTTYIPKECPYRTVGRQTMQATIFRLQSTAPIARASARTCCAVFTIAMSTIVPS